MGKYRTLPKSNNPAGGPVTYTEEVLEDMAEEMLAFYEANPNYRIPQKWMAKNRFHHAQIARFCKRSEKFADAWAVLKESICADRLFDATANERINASAGNFALAVIAKWNKETKIEVDQKVSGNITHTHEVDFSKVKHLFNDKDENG